MSEGVIPGLDGDIPAERRLLPDSLNALRAGKNGGTTVAYGGQQPAAGQGLQATQELSTKVS